MTKNSVRNPHKVPGHYEASYPSQLEWVTARTPNDSVDALLSAADAHPANFSVHLGHFEDHVWFNKTLLWFNKTLLLCEKISVYEK